MQDFPPSSSPAYKHEEQDINKSLREPGAKVWPRRSKLSKKRQRLSMEIAARWRYRLPIKNLTPHTAVSFVSALIFVLIRKPTDVYKDV